MSNNSIDIDNAMTEGMIVHKNVKQEILIVTREKVELCLMKNHKCLREKSDWKTPTGILIATITTLETATFQDAFFEAPVWKAIFIIVSILSFGWLAVTLINLYKNRHKGSVDSIITELQIESFAAKNPPKADAKSLSEPVYVIELPERVPKQILFDLKKILQEHPGSEKVQLKIGGEVVNLPLKVKNSPELKVKVEKLIKRYKNT